MDNTDFDWFSMEESEYMEECCGIAALEAQNEESEDKRTYEEG